MRLQRELRPSFSFGGRENAVGINLLLKPLEERLARALRCLSTVGSGVPRQGGDPRSLTSLAGGHHQGEVLPVRQC